MKRFEFCGKLDCPDWILAQLFHASKLDIKTFELICQSVKDTIFNDGQLDELNLFTQLGIYDLQYNVAPSDLAFDIDDARACFGAIHYIMGHACIYKVTAKQLKNEMEQLGLASEHSRTLCNIFEDNFVEMRAKLTTASK